jgi:hypothetical protein
MRFALNVVLTVAFAASTVLPAGAWGAQGHLIITGVGAAAFPDALPAFVRAPEAVALLRALANEPDHVRGAGRAFDDASNACHCINLDDDASVAGRLPLAQLPPTRHAYDDAVPGRDHGYLPYSIVEGWELVVRDFAIWRVERYGEDHARSESDRAAFAAERRLREQLTLHDIGIWSHFVGDASQPLHVSVHYNGWGDYPNPRGYSNSNTIHARFETDFVNRYATDALVAARLRPYVPNPGLLLPRVLAYIGTSHDGVEPIYRFEAAGAFASGSPEAVAFMLDRLAAAAQALRDWTADAYAAAADQRLEQGVSVRDVESGREAPNPRNYR